MKKIMIMMIFLIMTIFLSSKDPYSLPSVKIKDLSNKTIDTKTFSNDGKPMILSFWATWCKPCLDEMSVYKEKYEEWQNETGVKLIAVSIDDSRNSKKVAPFVRGKMWKFDVYLDENQDFRRAMNVTHPPHTFLLNGKGEVVWQHIGFAQGDEDELYKELMKLKDENQK